MKVHAVVARTLLDYGVDTIFGVLGDANLQMIVDFVDFVDGRRGRFVGSVHEGGAVSMADGYSRVGCRVGVAAVTHGPGATNTATALTEAVRARSALIVLTGDTPPQADHLQRIDLPTLAALSGAEYRRVLAPECAAADLVRALRRAESASRPVLLDIPAAIAEADIDQAPHRVVAPWRPRAVAPEAEDLDRALGVVASAQRPVLVAGRGAVRSNARAVLCELAHLLGAPVATTLLARDYFRDYPANLGVMGTLSTETATDVLLHADCLVAFGVGLNRFTTADGSLLVDKALVRVDIDASRLAQDVRATVDVLGDARASAQSMVTQLRAAASDARDGWCNEISADPPTFIDRGTESAPDVRAAMICLDEMLPAHRVVVTDTGRFVTAPWKYLHVQRPTDFAHTLNFASIGLGIGTAVGAAAAQPDRLTVAVAGDGGAMMGIVELATAVAIGLPLLVIVCNDGAYGMEHRALSQAGLDPKLSLLPWPGFAPIATALGAEGLEVRGIVELERAVKSLKFPLRRPALIDIKIDPHVDIDENP